MIDVKMSLVVALQGGVMISKQACLKNAKNDVKNFNESAFEELFTKNCCDTHTLFVLNDKKEQEKIVYHTRKCKPAYQVLQISTLSYEYFIGNTAPEGFLPSMQNNWQREKSWKSATPEMRLMWHLLRIAESLGGQIKEYTVFND